MNSKVLAAIASLAAVGMGLMLARSRQQVSTLRAEIEAARATNAELAEKTAAMESSQVAPGELERLRAEQQEAIRLRGEVTRMKTEVAQAQAAAARQASAQKAGAAAAATPQGGEEAAPVEIRTFALKARGAVPAGSTMTVGGWETKPGVHTFALMTPVANGNNVTVQARWVEGPRDVVQALNQFGDAVSRGSRLLTAEQAAALVTALQETEGVNFLSSPTVETTSGREAIISVGQTMPGPNNTFVHVGPQLTLTPIVGADGTIDLSADARVNVPTTEAPPARR